MAPVIDVHCHHLPGAFVARLADEGPAHGVRLASGDAGTVLVVTGVAGRPMPPGIGDVDERLRWMDRRGIDVQVLSVWIEATAYELPDEHGVWLSRALNDALAEEVASHPDRLAAMASVPLQVPEAAAAELRRAEDELGLHGVEIASSVAGRGLDDPGLEPFWAAAEELSAPVLLHPHRALRGVRLERHMLWNVAGNPAEETIAAYELIFGGVLERHRDLTVILTHGGGFLPYQIGRGDRAHTVLRGARSGSPEPPSALLRRFLFDTITHDPTSLAFLVARVGADRVVLGSDHPFPMGDDDPVATVDAAGLCGPDRDGVLGGNAARHLLGPAARRPPS